MRGLTLTFALLLSTALAAQQHHPTPPPQMPKPPQGIQPVRLPPTSPTILPFPPLPQQPAGGFTPGVAFPSRDNPIYSPMRGRRGSGAYNGAYGGAYFYAPDVGSASAAPVAPAPAAGLLRLTGTPDSAQVFVDGYYVSSLADVEAQRALTLPAGPHRIELKAADYTPTTFDVRIDPNETISYRASLEPARPQPPVRTAAPASGPTKMYLIPNCYLGNVPPKAERLPRGCDAKRVQVIS